MWYLWCIGEDGASLGVYKPMVSPSCERRQRRGATWRHQRTRSDDPAISSAKHAQATKVTWFTDPIGFSKSPRGKFENSCAHDGKKFELLLLNRQVRLRLPQTIIVWNSFAQLKQRYRRWQRRQEDDSQHERKIKSCFDPVLILICKWCGSCLDLCIPDCECAFALWTLWRD